MFGLRDHPRSNGVIIKFIRAIITNNSDTQYGSTKLTNTDLAAKVVSVTHSLLRLTSWGS